MTLHLQVSDNGRIIIPKKIRDLLGIKAGSMVVASLVNNTLHITSTENSLKKAKDLVEKYCADTDLVEELIVMRRQEFEQEKIKFKQKNKYND